MITALLFQGGALMGMVGSASAAGCAEPVQLQRLLAELAAAEEGYAGLDASSFVDAVDIVVLDLPCVAVAVPPSAAARYHVLMGLRWYVEGDEAQSRAAFAAARASDPGLVVSTALIPEGHELRSWVETAPAGSTIGVPKAASGALLFDGTKATERPVERPSILQVMDSADQVVATCYLQPDDTLPPYPAVPELPFDPRRAATDRKRRWGWLVAGGVGTAASLSLYGLAAASAGRFAGPLPEEVGRPELLELRTRTNLLVAGSLLTGSVGAIGVTGFLVRW